jgi:hypothetical protein
MVISMYTATPFLSGRTMLAQCFDPAMSSAPLQVNTLHVKVLEHVFFRHFQQVILSDRLASRKPRPLVRVKGSYRKMAYYLTEKPRPFVGELHSPPGFGTDTFTFAASEGTPVGVWQGRKAWQALSRKNTKKAL